MDDYPVFGFGTYRLCADTYEAVQNALKCGYVHIDTAPLYKNEESVGGAIYTSGIDRKKIYVTTKISRNELKKNNIVDSIQNSLRNLRLDYIDEIVLHEPIDIIHNWRSLCEYYHTKGKGIVKNIGVSNYNIDDINAIMGDTDNMYLTSPYVNQIEVNPFLTRGDLPKYCMDRGINIVAHSPLAKAEKLDNSILCEMGNKYGTTPAKIMLMWSKYKGYRIIPRSSKLHHIKENIQEIGKKMSHLDIHILDELNCGYATHPQYIKKV
jgi:diketogulonate reductase-like aldo/keto reductase